MLVSFEPIIIFGGLFFFLIFKFIWKCVTYFPCCSLIVLSFGQEKKFFLCHTWIFWSHCCWMNYTSLWKMRLCHFYLLWAIYVFFFFFLDTLSLVTLLRLFNWPFFLKALIHSVSRWNLISLFQCGGLCKNKKRKEKRIQRKKKGKMSTRRK